MKKKKNLFNNNCLILFNFLIILDLSGLIYFLNSFNKKEAILLLLICYYIYIINSKEKIIAFYLFNLYFFILIKI